MAISPAPESSFDFSLDTDDDQLDELLIKALVGAKTGNMAAAERYADQMVAAFLEQSAATDDDDPGSTTGLRGML